MKPQLVEGTLKLCVIVFSSHYHILQHVKMLNCFADSIMKTYFDRYVQSTPIRKPHISEITGSCCLYTRYILVFGLSQNFSSISNSSIHTSLQTQSKIFLHSYILDTYQSSDLVKIFLQFQIVVYLLVFSFSQNFSLLSNSSIHTSLHSCILDTY